MIYLITGNCGTGKTWVMLQLLKHFELNPNIYTYATGKYRYVHQRGLVVIGVYDGTTFAGSDRLSMAVMLDNKKVKPLFDKNIVIAEGDRFTNSTFINEFQPTILKILGDGSEGRALRGSNQTERHLKSIATRVQNVPAALEFKNAGECLNYLISVLPEYRPQE